MQNTRKSQPFRIKNQPHTLADRVKIPRPQSGYALPYYTRNGIDTEYLISNHSMSVVSGTLIVFGPECRVMERLQFDLLPDCTYNVFMRPIVPNHAGHIILVVSLPVVVHVMYNREEDRGIVGDALADKDNLFHWRQGEKTRTYGFGYRALPLGPDTLDGAVFVSNPNAIPLTGVITFFDQDCELVVRKKIAISPGCTEEYPFPQGRYGYGRIQISNQAAINVLHFAASAHGLTAAELLGEANLIEVPPEPPKPGNKVLFDDTHGCRPGATGDWTDYETALIAAGYTVAHHTAPTVTLADLQAHDVFVIAVARGFYDPAEKQAITSFVSGGGGLMIVQDYGIPPPTPAAPWSAPTREVLNLFGANDDNNMVQDAIHNNSASYNPPFAVIFDYQRNFLTHPIVNGWKYFGIDAICSLSGGTGWTTIVETDDDSIPVRRPVLLGRSYGSGRVLAYGDSNTWANYLIGSYENKLFGIRCAEWLLFRI